MIFLHRLFLTLYVGCVCVCRCASACGVYVVPEFVYLTLSGAFSQFVTSVSYLIY